MKKIIWVFATIAALSAAGFLFPPVFSGRVILPQGITLGGFAFRWYGLILASSVVIGYLVARKNSWRFGISGEEVDDLAFWLVLASLISARIYYVLSMGTYYIDHPSEIVRIWHGGLSIYGALIGGALFLYFYSRKKIYSSAQLFDLVALSLPLSQAFGRLGNFFNYEAFGRPTDLPWKMYVPAVFRPEQFANNNFFHPAFLYELAWNVLVCCLLFAMRGRVKNGVICLSYVGLYSVGRFFIEPLRLDSALLGSFRLDQLVAFGGVVLSMFFILFIYWKDKKIKPLAA